MLVWGLSGGTHRTQGVCLCLCRSPQGACWIVEVNESDWLLGVFLLLLQFAHWPFYFILSLASSLRCVKDKVVDEINTRKVSSVSCQS